MQFNHTTPPCPDKSGKDLASDPHLTSLVRIARKKGNRHIAVPKKLVELWPYLTEHYDLELGEANSLHEAWLVNVAWLYLRQTTGELYLSLEVRALPYAVLGDEGMTEEDTIRFHVASVALGFVMGMGEAREQTPFFESAMHRAGATCDLLGERYPLSLTPTPGRAGGMAKQMSVTPEDSMTKHWHANLLGMAAYYNGAISMTTTGHRPPMARRQK